MIQRIQTLYLVVVFILSLASFKVPFVKLADTAENIYAIKITGLVKGEGEIGEVPDKSFLMTLIVVSIPIVILLTIALFKNRKYQKILILVSVLLILLQIIYSGILAMNVLRNSDFSIRLSPGPVMIISMLILLFFAWKGVQHDEDLVKSYERMR